MTTACLKHATAESTCAMRPNRYKLRRIDQRQTASSMRSRQAGKFEE